VEKYRPTNLDTYIGNEQLKIKLKSYIESQDIPHLLFYGTAGTGKTTAAKILVNNIDCDYLFINASDERGIDVVRDRIKTFASTIGFSPLKIVVLDECDFLTKDAAQPALRNLMEVYSNSTRFILTANYIERIIDPLVSRTQSFKITPPSRKDVAKAMANILTKEGVSYDIKTLAQVVNTYYPDIRKIINTCQLQTDNYILSVSIDDLIGADFKLKVIDILSGSLEFKEKINLIRQLIADEGVQDFTELYQILFEHVEVYAPSKIPQAIIAIADGQFRDGQVPDKEINFIATLYSILIN
jgi:replication factor C small subunit